MWITKEQAKAKDKSVKGHGDKRQFTLLASTSAAGKMLKHQVVLEGSTARSLPDFSVGHKKLYVKTRQAPNSKQRKEAAGKAKEPKQPKEAAKKGKEPKEPAMSSCFVLNTFLSTASLLVVTAVTSVSNIASFCVTPNHWSDDVTSRAYIEDVAVPYFKAEIEALRAQDEALSKPFGVQVCVLIVDCWYGWIDEGFKNFLKTKYPWIRLLFVPASCTPVAQPMDAGIIAKIKGKLRKLYGAWVVLLTRQQLDSNVPPEKIHVPADVPMCKKNLFEWLSTVVDMCNKDQAGIVHCWENTQLLRAWERPVQVALPCLALPHLDETGLALPDSLTQLASLTCRIRPVCQVEATRKVKELFPNLADVPSVDLTLAQDSSPAEDEEAGELGKPFTQLAGFGDGDGDEEEWAGWVDWESLGSSA